jgi:hypothetical protein
VRLDVSPLRVAPLVRLALVIALLCAPLVGGVGSVAAQSDDCAPPTYAVVADDGRPTVLEASAGCQDGRHTYDESWTATYASLGNENGSEGLPTDVRDATPAADGGWWLLGETALHRVDEEWRPTGETVALPTANGTSAATANETGRFDAVARDGVGRLWLAGARGVVVLNGTTGAATPTDVARATGLYAEGDRLWALREGVRGGQVTRYALNTANGTTDVSTTVEASVRIGPEVRRPVDLTRVETGWLVVSAERNLFVYSTDWTYTGERYGSSGLFAATVLLLPAALLVAFGGVVVLRLRRELLGRYVVVAIVSTALAVAVRQSLLPPAARELYALPSAAVAAILLAPWAVSVLTVLRKGAWAVLAGILLLAAGIALPIASEYIVAV